MVKVENTDYRVVGSLFRADRRVWEFSRIDFKDITELHLSVISPKILADSVRHSEIIYRNKEGIVSTLCNDRCVYNSVLETFIRLEEKDKEDIFNGVPKETADLVRMAIASYLKPSPNKT
jgi:hypothetical protein